MKIINSNDLINYINECNDLSLLFSQIQIFVSNKIYYKNEKLKKTIIKRLKYLCQKEKNPPNITQLHFILFHKGCCYDIFLYELYELYINYMIGKNQYNNNIFPISDFSFITFILSLDIDLYLDSDNILLKNYCNENIWKLISYICQIYDIYPENNNLNKFINYISEFISCDLLFESIKNIDYSIFLKSITNDNNLLKDKDSYINLLKQIYKIIEDLYNYTDKKYEFIDKIVFFDKKYKKLFQELETLSKKYYQKNNMINYYIDIIYGTFINFPFEMPINNIKITLECIIRNLLLVISNQSIDLIHSYGNYDININQFNYYEISDIIKETISILFEFKNYSNIEKRDEIEKIINDICNKLKKEKNNVFALESYQINSLDSALEAYKKYSGNIQRTQNRIYNAYKTYKTHENKIDSQANKVVGYMKKMILGDKRKELIEGKKFTIIGLLKKLLGGYAAFSIAPIAAALALVVRFALNKKTTRIERKKLAMELETELKLLDEKIDDAKGAGDNKAKYSLMRTRSEVSNALKKIQYGIEADEKSINSVKKILK